MTVLQSCSVISLAVTSALGQNRRSDETSGMSALRLIAAEYCTAAAGAPGRNPTDLRRSQRFLSPAALVQRCDFDEIQHRSASLADVSQLLGQNWHAQIAGLRALNDTRRDPSAVQSAVYQADVTKVVPAGLPSLIKRA